MYFPSSWSQCSSIPFGGRYCLACVWFAEKNGAGDRLWCRCDLSCGSIWRWLCLHSPPSSPSCPFTSPPSPPLRHSSSPPQSVLFCSCFFTLHCTLTQMSRTCIAIFHQSWIIWWELDNRIPQQKFERKRHRFAAILPKQSLWEHQGTMNCLWN